MIFALLTFEKNQCSMSLNKKISKIGNDIHFTYISADNLEDAKIKVLGIQNWQDKIDFSIDFNMNSNDDQYLNSCFAQAVKNSTVNYSPIDREHNYYDYILIPIEHIHYLDICQTKKEIKKSLLDMIKILREKASNYITKCVKMKVFI